MRWYRFEFEYKYIWISGLSRASFFFFVPEGDLTD